MGVKSVNFSSSYAVQDGKEVKLTIVVGNGQFGTSLVTAAGKSFPAGDIANLAIGKGDKLRGKTLTIKSVVTDTNDKTNATSLTYKLAGGTSPMQSVVSATVDAEGDSVVYRASIDLV